VPLRYRAASGRRRFGGSGPPGRTFLAKNARTRAMASGSSGSAGRSSARCNFSRLRLVVVTIAGFRSVTARSRSASPGVLGCASPPWSGGEIEEKTEPPPFRVGRRLLFVVTTAGTSSATAFRFLGGRSLRPLRLPPGKRCQWASHALMRAYATWSGEG
jgi:hypothetical protein